VRVATVDEAIAALGRLGGDIDGLAEPRVGQEQD